MATKKSAKTAPKQVTLRSYNVGFGDCFLLSFHYATGDRHVLIDFGTMKKPLDNADPKLMTKIAGQIASDCGGKLTAVIASHRHKDHISGFSRSNGKGPGEIIRGLNPDLVVQPWTEDPKLSKTSTGPTASQLVAKKKLSLSQHTRLHALSLANMNRYADFAARFGATLTESHLKDLGQQLVFLGEDNGVANPDAVENLRTMGKKRNYVYFGSDSGLGALLPGVKVSVLGPPTLRQTDTIAKMRDWDADEFWATNQARGDFWARRAAVAERDEELEAPLFPRHVEAEIPQEARWYSYYARRELAESQLAIVRSLDDQMNNTSVILLFEVGSKMLLFPGDAQYENWMYALSKPEIAKKLKKVDLYKVGHHGSRNATPKSLWEGFTKRGGKNTKNRLMSFISTRDHAHGLEKNNAEVPRRTLMTTLAAESQVFDTRKVSASQMSLAETIDV